jgi:hypothetical protein
MSRLPTTCCLVTASLLAFACAAARPTPKPVIRIPPRLAVGHARGEQVGVAAREGEPDLVQFHTVSGVTQWVYCGDRDRWVRVFDFDASGDVLVALDLFEDDDSVCAGVWGSAPPAAPGSAIGSRRHAD